MTFSVLAYSSILYV